MTTISVDVDEYVAAVAAALADLRAEARAELLEDLPEHLAEVLAECDAGTMLRDRLGEPRQYAAELRAAAGYPELAAGRGPAQPGELVADLLVRFRTRLGHADRALGALLGYGRLISVARSLQPGWWVLRGWIVALMITLKFNSVYWTGYIPRVFGSLALGAVLVVVCVLVSAWVGRRTARGTMQTRVLATLVSITIGIFGIFIARNVAGWEYAYYHSFG